MPVHHALQKLDWPSFAITSYSLFLIFLARFSYEQCGLGRMADPMLGSSILERAAAGDVPSCLSRSPHYAVRSIQQHFRTAV